MCCEERTNANIFCHHDLSVTIVSMLRLQSIKYYANTTNPTWDQFDLVWYSTIEVSVGIICTCLPSMRLVLMHFAPKTFGQRSKRSVDEPLALCRSNSSPREVC